MTLTFPTNPTIGQEFSGGGKAWAWTGAAWETVATNSVALPEGAKTLVTSGYSSSSAYTYTPSTSLPAGSYMLTASACQSLYAKVGDNKFKSNDERIVFRSSSVISKIDFKADHEIDFSDLDIFQSPNPLHYSYATSDSSNGYAYSKYLGQSRGVHYAYQHPSARIFKSLDAVNWIDTTISADQVFQGRTSHGLITTIGNKTVIMGAYRTLETSDLGVTWVQFQHSLNFQAVAYGNGVFVGLSGLTVYTSPDGYTWTSRGAVFPATADALIFDGSKFVAVGYGKVLTSSDGVTWVQKATNAGSASQPTYQLVYNGSLYMMLNNTSECWTSTDTVTWVQKTAFPGTSKGLIYFNGKFAAINQGVTRAYATSVDGASWASATVTDNKLVSSMTTLQDWGLDESKSSLFVIAGTSSGINTAAYAKTADMLNWTIWGNEETVNFSSARYGRNGSDHYFASSINIYKTSDAGKTWSAWSVTTPTAYNLQAFTYADGKFFAVGQVSGVTYSTYWHSNDAVTWTYGSANAMSGYFSHGYSDGKYLYTITNSSQYAYRFSAASTTGKSIYLGTTTQQYFAGTANGFTYYHNGNNLFYIDWSATSAKYGTVYSNVGRSTAAVVTGSDVRVMYVDGSYVAVVNNANGVVYTYIGKSPDTFSSKIVSPNNGMRFIGCINDVLYFAGNNNTTTYNTSQYFPVLKLSNLNSSYEVYYDSTYVSPSLEATGQNLPFGTFRLFGEFASSNLGFSNLGPAYTYVNSNNLRGIAVLRPKPTYFSLYALEQNYYN